MWQPSLSDKSTLLRCEIFWKQPLYDKTKALVVSDSSVLQTMSRTAPGRSSLSARRNCMPTWCTKDGKKSRPFASRSCCLTRAVHFSKATDSIGERWSLQFGHSENLQIEIYPQHVMLQWLQTDALHRNVNPYVSCDKKHGVPTFPWFLLPCLD